MKAIKGTQIEAGMTLVAYRATVVSVQYGQLAAGAKFADVTLSSGETERCWEGFLYFVS